jgi:hypothetical protein
MNFVAALNQGRADRAHKLSFGHGEALSSWRSNNAQVGATLQKRRRACVIAPPKCQDLISGRDSSLRMRNDLQFRVIVIAIPHCHP